METKHFLTHVNSLRGLAILLVFLYHLQDAFCPQGFLGVDAFYVISGFFLIPPMLRASESGVSFSWWKYYKGKITRILPPLLVMSICVLVLGILVMDVNDLAIAAKTARKVITGLSNVYFGTRSLDYFAQDVKENPFLHTWYISVLLQMLLIAPLVCIPLSKLRSHWRTIILSALMALSLLIFYQHLLPDTWQQSLPALIKEGGELGSVYYMTAGRVWELLAGAFILMLPACGQRGVRTVLLGLGVIMLAAPCFWSSPHYSDYSLIAVLGTMLIIRYGEDTHLSSLLENKIFMWLGSISFSLYLMHWPVMALSRYALVRDFQGLDYIWIILVSLLLTWALYRWVEKRRPSLISIVVLWGACMLLTVGIRHIDKIHSWLGIEEQTETYYGSLEYKDWKLADDKQWNPPYSDVLDVVYAFYGDEVIQSDSPLFGKKPILQIGDPGKRPNFVVIGDSYANSLFPGLDIVGKEEGWSGLQLNLYVTPFWDRLNLETPPPSCHFNEAKAEAMLEWLSHNEHLKTVIVVQRWDVRWLPSKTWDGTPIPKEEVYSRNVESIREFCRRLKALGREVYMIMPTPEVSLSEMKVVVSRLNRAKLWYHRLFPGRTIEAETTCTTADYERINKDVLPTLRLMEKEEYCKLLDPMSILFTDGVFKPLTNNELLVYDSGHLTVAGAVKTVRGLKDQFNAIFQREENEGSEGNEGSVTDSSQPPAVAP